MSADLVAALATSGATTIVQAAATDTWAQTKHGFARLFGRGNATATTQAEMELENTTTALATRTGDALKLARRQQEARWEAALIDLLLNYPNARQELSELLAGAGAYPAIHITANARDNAQQAIQGTGTQNVAFGASPQNASIGLPHVEGGR